MEHFYNELHEFNLTLNVNNKIHKMSVSFQTAGLVNCVVSMCLWRFSLYQCLFGFTAGISQLSRTAGSNPCLSERLTPGKMPTLTCLPKKKTTIFIKSNVCAILVLWYYILLWLLFLSRNTFNLFGSCLLIFFFSVHNVKPECLDDYNELWWVTFKTALSQDT